MCRWNLVEYNLYNPVSGITSNQSESFNSVLKRVQEWKEIPVDSAVLSLYHLQGYYWNEWQWGLSGFYSILSISFTHLSVGLGEFSICEELQSHYYIPCDELCSMEVFSLDQIVSKLRNLIFTQLPDKNRLSNEKGLWYEYNYNSYSIYTLCA